MLRLKRLTHEDAYYASGQELALVEQDLEGVKRDITEYESLIKEALKGGDEGTAEEYATAILELQEYEKELMEEKRDLEKLRIYSGIKMRSEGRMGENVDVLRKYASRETEKLKKFNHDKYDLRDVSTKLGKMADASRKARKGAVKEPYKSKDVQKLLARYRSEIETSEKEAKREKDEVRRLVEGD